MIIRCLAVLWVIVCLIDNVYNKYNILSLSCVYCTCMHLLFEFFLFFDALSLSRLIFSDFSFLQLI